VSVEETICAECGARVAKCDNEILLDLPAYAGGEWTVMSLGSMDLAATDGRGVARGHDLHAHQPDNETP
jgi:hypothetical protein